MAKKASSQVIETLKAENETLKAENERLTTELKQKTDELEYAQRWYKSCQEEIDRCNKLLDLIEYDPDSIDKDLSVRLMGVLLKTGECKCVSKTFENKGE